MSIFLEATLPRALASAVCVFSITLVSQAKASYFTNTSPMSSARAGHTATLLDNGKVLVAGGGSGVQGQYSWYDAEIFDSASATWTNTAKMNVLRSDHTATLLSSGMVLVTGGLDIHNTILTNAELFDPATMQWTNTGSLNTARYACTATRLLNGKVLAASGQGIAGKTAAVELYDLVSGSWTNVNPLHQARALHTATLLADGRVLVVGGVGATGNILASAELYNPTNGTWTLTGGLGTAREYHTATLLPDGRVMVTGGICISNVPTVLSSTEVYDPTTGIWTPAGAMRIARREHIAILLPNGKVLVAGGWNDTVVWRSAEIFDPTAGVWAPTGNMAAARLDMAATLLTNGKVLIVGGGDGGYDASAELFFSPRPFELLDPVLPPGGTFQFTFSNLPGLSFTAFAATNLSQPTSTWKAAGTITEISPGQFQFIDAQAMNFPRRFYRVGGN